MKRYALSLAALLAAAAVSAAQADEDPRTRAAQMVALAEVAPQECDSLTIDRNAVAAYVKNANMSETEITTQYADVARTVAAGFARSIEGDAAATCSQVWDMLGDQGLGLLTSAEN